MFLGGRRGRPCAPAPHCMDRGQCNPFLLISHHYPAGTHLVFEPEWMRGGVDRRKFPTAAQGSPSPPIEGGTELTVHV